MEQSFASRWAPIFLSLMRIAVALIFIQHGTQKFLGFPSAPANGFPAMMSLGWWQGIIELVGGGLLLIGLFTRAVAFVLAGDMAVAYWMVHAPKNYLYPILNGGDLAVVLCFVFLFIAFAGGGPLGVDRSSK